MDRDLYEILLACAEDVNPAATAAAVWWKEGLVACSVVCASRNYGQDGITESLLCRSNRSLICGFPLSCESSANAAKVLLCHAGATLIDEAHPEKGVVTNGGRVLTVTGLGASLRQARDSAYKAVASVSFDGMQYRSDIGKR